MFSSKHTTTKFLREQSKEREEWHPSAGWEVDDGRSK
jgi:hypothetical protein